MTAQVRRLSPAGRGAVAILSVEGPGALAAVATLTGGRAPPLGRPVLRRLVQGDLEIEEALVFAEGPERAELHLHGSPALVERVARGLEAQYQAALIRDRRLADDRELRLIADYEARLTQARRRADSRVAGAQAELERARADYAQLVETIALRDAASRAEIEAYRAEAQGLAAEATPERLAALQRFADGDRVGAWPALETIRLAEDRAIEAASNTRRAVRWRQDAELRDIMRFNREATTEQVLALWEQAAALDPTDFWTQMNCEIGRAHV